MAKPTIPADALVFFGATGDLAYKKIFPAIQDSDSARTTSKFPLWEWPSRDGA